MKTLLLKVICGLSLIATIVCIVYGCKNDATETYVYEDNINVELTDDAAETMAYYYNQADEEFKAMYGLED